MKKLYAYLALIPIIGLALIPPISWGIDSATPEITSWLILLAGFFGIYTIFLKTSIFVKIIAVGGFVNCFFSTMPFISFISYMSLVACCYFYILCTKITDWAPIFKAIIAIVALNMLMLGMQFLGKDSLLNFGLPSVACLGTIGSGNQLGGLINACSAMLISLNPINFLLPLITGITIKSMGTFFAGAIGLIIWSGSEVKTKTALLIAAALMAVFIFGGIKQNDFIQGSGRTPVWKKTISLAKQHPIAGWGMGSYKYIMDSYIPTFRMAHNSSLQVLFEFGLLGLLLLVIILATLAYNLARVGEIKCLAGLGIILTDSMLHFPERQIQVVLILVAFIAYCTHTIRNSTRSILE